MKLGKLTATALGSVVTLFGLNSCAKKQECCDMSFSDAGDTYNTKFCEDGTYEATATYSDGSSYSYTGNWTEDYTWDELKSQGALVAAFGGTFECDDEKVKK